LIVTNFTAYTLVLVQDALQENSIHELTSANYSSML